MKKLLAVIAFSASIFGVSCSKDKPAQPGGSAVHKSIAMTQVVETPGAVHNKVLADYIAIYGLSKNQVVTKEESHTIIKRCGDLLKLKYPEVDPTVFDQASEGIFSFMVEQGYYVDGNLISVAQMNSKNIALAENESIRTVLNNINGYVGDNFIDYNTYQLNYLSLSGKDAIIRNALVSVGNSSHSFWDGYWPGTPSEVTSCARADEYAFLMAYTYVFDHLVPPLREGCSAGYAAAVSYAAYKKYGY